MATLFLLLAMIASFSVPEVVGDGDGPIDSSFGEPTYVDCSYYTDGCS